MTAFQPTDATVFDTHGSRFRSFVRTDTGSAELCAWQVDIPAGAAGVSHRPTKEEVFLVLAGRLIMKLDGEPCELGPGDVFLVPAGGEIRVDAGPDGGTAWVTTSRGLQAALPDGSVISPPWAQ